MAYTSDCPECGQQLSADSQEELLRMEMAHMEQLHPSTVSQRLRDNGLAAEPEDLYTTDRSGDVLLTPRGHAVAKEIGISLGGDIE